MTRLTAHPAPGFFQIRLVKGGPFVPARIYRPCACTINGPAEHDWQDTCDRYSPLAAEIDGKPGGLWRLWTYGKIISRNDYQYMTDLREWSLTCDPLSPQANPGQPIDLGQMDPVF